MISYMQILKAFGDFSGELSPNEQVLFFRLFLINNKAGWAEWFGATNRRILLETGIKSEKTLISCRDKLKQKGLIDYKQGHKGVPTRYTIASCIKTVTNTVNTTVKTTVKNTVKNTVNPTVKTTVKNTDIKDYKTKTNNKLLPTEQKVIDLYENCIHPICTVVEQDTLMDLMQDFGYEWVEQAVTEAAKSGGRTVRYITSILTRWRNTGKNKPWEVQRERRTSGGIGKSNCNAQGEAGGDKWENETSGWSC